jgi:hypothetical protein
MAALDSAPARHHPSYCVSSKADQVKGKVRNAVGGLKDAVRGK